jgi:mannose-6-phosphate isomerase-like protein (cupin superfamily)
MKYIAKSSAKKVDVGAGDVLEYSLGDPDIDIAIATINGKYPKQGFVVNEDCKELLYVISGHGKFATKEQAVELNPGDQALIEKGEIFKYDDCIDLVVVAACTPAWTPAQHKEVA